MKGKTRTANVHISAVSFPDSIVPVMTSVPAFIGYTPKAEHDGKSLYNTPVKITCFEDFKTFFMLADPPAPSEPAKQYSPQYYLVKQKAEPAAGDFMVIAGQYYSILYDPCTVYYLYNSVRLFYQNGGGDAYIVAIGSYGPPAGKPQATPGMQIINPNVRLDGLLKGLALLKNEQEPTLYICPEATLLTRDDNAALMQAMLLQAGQMQTAMCLFDIIGGRDPDAELYMQDIENFRADVGDAALSYGASYYPFLLTTVMQRNEIDFANFFGGDVTQLEPLLNPPAVPNTKAAAILKMIESLPAPPLTNSGLHTALLNASPDYARMIAHVFNDVNILPPSGAMAGIYAHIDAKDGVWQAPANVGIIGAADLTIHLGEDQQSGLNIDAVSGKSINAIRFFNGLGILVWGARTLDGNSQDWRYINVRRTVTFIEQSIKQAMQAYVFAPNDSNTWEAIKSMVNAFLTGVWKEGGLQGATPADAFSVNIGLGTTMTADDILNGYIRMAVKVAVTHPAEFIVITVEQQLAQP